MNTKNRSRIVKGISFEPYLLTIAKEKAQANKQSLSAYLNKLISDAQSCQLSSTLKKAKNEN